MADADSTNTPQWSTAPLPVAEERLPSLAIALDPERMKAVFAPWVHERFGDAGIENLEIEVYRRHINRCVVRYTVECQVKGDGRRTWQVIGKVLADDRGPQVHETMRRLWQLGFDRDARDGITMPEPIAYVPSLAMLLQEAVGGKAVRNLIRESADPAPCRVAARTLVKLHRSSLKAGPARRIPDLLRRCHPRYPFLALACPEVADAVHTIADRSLAIEAALGHVETTPLHGDFHMGQVHVAGDRSWLIDFDAVGRGDPASDVGNIAVFLKDKVRRRPAAEEFLQAFLDEYFTHMDPAIAFRIPLYEAVTHLRRACKLLRFQRRGWRDRVRDMLARGLGSIEAMEARLPERRGVHRSPGASPSPPGNGDGADG
ncbi:MAG: hypothetical protein DMD82_03710 [Candidatus Rokuibacteriota bacterium]|nr:MAG: hypothetical protein DMD82_03710 [Candidatus Rokubacteria bacterium]